MRLSLVAGVSCSAHAGLRSLWADEVAAVEGGDAAARAAGAGARATPEALLLLWVNHHLVAGGCGPVGGFGPEMASGAVYATLLRAIAPEVAAGTALEEPGAAPAALHAATVAALSTLGAPSPWLDGGALGSDSWRLHMAAVALLFRGRDAIEVPPTTTGGSGAPQLVSGGAAAEASARREMRTAALWIDSLNVEGVHVTDVVSDLRDGVVLLRLLDDFEPKCVDWKRGAHSAPVHKMQRIENCNLAFAIAERMGMNVVGNSGLDIEAGNPKMVMSIVWQLMRAHMMQLLGGADVNEFVAVANALVAGTGVSAPPIESLKDASLATGVFLLALVYAVRPVVDWTLVSAGGTPAERLSNARCVPGGFVGVLAIAFANGAARICIRAYFAVVLAITFAYWGACWQIHSRMGGGAQVPALRRAEGGRGGVLL